MNRIRLFSGLLLLLPAALPANLRAPWHIQPFSAFSLMPAGRVQGLTVLGETLEFNCQALFEGDADADKLRASACMVKAAYRFKSGSSANAALEFVGPSAEGLTVHVNGELTASAVSRIEMERNAAARYAAYPACRHCASDEMPLYSAKFKAAFHSGENEIAISYTQPLSSREVSYGYFQTSKWEQGFEYELWPLKEWNLSPDFQMQVRIRSPKPGIMARLFGDNHPWNCSGVHLGRRPPLPVAAGTGPGIDPEDLKQTDLPLQFSSDAWQWSTTFGTVFPDRLSCSMQ
jgi:hypothetical protein